MSSPEKPFVVVRGIHVKLLDLADKEDERPRATHYGPPAIYEMTRAGIIDEVREAGFVPEGVAWRKPDLSVIAAINSTILEDEASKMVFLPLNQLSKILVKHLSATPLASIYWQHRVVGIGQDDENAWVEVETPEGRKAILAPYIVGYDGANSQIGHSLFGDWELPGYTWKEQIVATNIYYDFEKFGLGHASFIIDRENWYMASRITNDRLWRVTYGDIPGCTDNELRARQLEKFRRMLPGNPRPDQYKLIGFSPYKVHQWLAKKMKVGRFLLAALLAADATHLCHPFGGLGLTGGLVDVCGLSDCFGGIYEGKADDEILDKYDEILRAKYTDIFNHISTENFKRIFDQDPEEAAEKGDAKKSHKFALGANAIQYDFTKHYKSKTTN
ncbi:putative monooxygenase [Bipolaris maydis]|nr:putative monooxygenase [Bipolaris maydis]